MVFGNLAKLAPSLHYYFLIQAHDHSVSCPMVSPFLHLWVNFFFCLMSFFSLSPTVMVNNNRLRLQDHVAADGSRAAVAGDRLRGLGRPRRGQPGRGRPGSIFTKTNFFVIINLVLLVGNAVIGAGEAKNAFGYKSHTLCACLWNG